MALENITKHRDLWFEDGNVVLIAETTGFCVYQGMLTKHSEVFRDRFAKQPSSSYLGMFRALFETPLETSAIDSNIGGRHLARLNDVGAEEVAIMLELLFNAGNSFYRNGVKVPFLTIAAALRLGTKYRLESMREEAHRRISICYARNIEDLHTPADDCLDPARCPIAWESKTDCIAVLHLARELGLDDLVPAALYRCANDVTIEQLFQAASPSNLDRLHRLSYQELQDCMQSRQDLLVCSLKLSRLAPEMKLACDLAIEEEALGWRKTIKNVILRERASKSLKAVSSIEGFSQDSNGWQDSLQLAYQLLPESTNAKRLGEIWSRLRIQYCPGGQISPELNDTSINSVAAKSD